MRNSDEVCDLNNAAHVRVDRLVQRVRSEYTEMPGLQLTISQARRLWGLDEETCAALLTTLIEQHFLFRTATGTHVRRE
jgi:hypothetical protein